MSQIALFDALPAWLRVTKRHADKYAGKTRILTGNRPATVQFA